ncbi:ATP-grasp domain-containing protein [Polyangium aurulentum]|uniref:arsenate reductase/protein-tyrosine-phosphatase family protein n=1 Tax=Polyangium aurulentum TaxID=2567896 RepID=UPI0010AE1180|nr:ATP-grasp domain-containing protein [Polyangium aurulentum]UQA55500.1 ATP-grasp domain-containing protein [Polyangium aurulentum]
MNIFILDGDSNASRAVVQSLGRKGYTCWLGATSTRHPAFASRYVAEKILYPDPMADKAAFKAWIAGFVRTHQFDLVIPTTERTLVPLHEMRADPVLAPIAAIPPPRALERSLDKEALRALATELGVPTPPSLLARSMKDLDDPRVDAWLEGGAIVVKSTKSKVWAGSSAKDFTTEIITRRDALLARVREQVAMTPVQIQPWLPGRGVGVELLVRRGEIVLSFAHERLHELPLTGGGSSYRRAIETPAAMLEDAARLARALDYHGVAMVEYRFDPETGRYWLMEVNARFWGSLPLAIFAGADFPAALVAMHLFDKRPDGPPPRTDVTARLFARDLQWTKAIVKNREGGPYLLTRPLGESLLEWSRIFTGRETWDGASLADPAPLVQEVYEAAREEFSAMGRKLRRAALLQAAQRASRQRMRELGNARRLLLLCHGNICRSAYAEARLRTDPRLAGVEVRSAGFHRAPGRKSPDHFRQVAAARGVELETHRSRIVDPEDVRWADAIVVMDQRNYDLLRELSPEALGKVVWLGSLGEGRGPEIADPYSEAPEKIAVILDQMDRCLERFADSVQAG